MVGENASAEDSGLETIKASRNPWVQSLGAWDGMGHSLEDSVYGWFTRASICLLQGLLPKLDLSMASLPGRGLSLTFITPGNQL